MNANDAQLLRELFLELPVGAVNWGTDGGMRPPFAALQVHKVEMVEVLLGYGADTRYEIEPATRRSPPPCCGAARSARRR